MYIIFKLLKTKDKGEIIWEIILNDSEVENLNGPISKKEKPRSYRIIMLQRAAGLGDWLVSEFFQVPKQSLHHINEVGTLKKLKDA